MTAAVERFKEWLTAELKAPEGPHGSAEHTYPWWLVLCLTGVDYFSTLAYQPSIAFLACGLLSPFATAVLVLVTLGAALPTYRKVAEESPDGQGSISLLERVLPRWRGKAAVLVLLGFAATDFMITITLSAADAAEHLVENPYTPLLLRHQIGVSLLLVLILGFVFLMGFREAILLAALIVSSYLSLNAAVLARCFQEVARHPDLLGQWWHALRAEYGSGPLLLITSMIVFPKLALGLSGFETGVTVMPLVKPNCNQLGDPIQGRIRNTKKLLAAAALIMSCFLILSSFVTVLLIPPEALREGGPADGRAISWLAHHFFGEKFGAVYDLVTIAILWFAGASAMAGLLNLIPRYLPRYGMAPEWARASRPLVVLITMIGLLITLIFKASVDAQAGAYATGVLVLMTSAAAGAFLTARNRRGKRIFGVILIVFTYTTLLNIVERPEGIKISTLFILSITAVSLASRAARSTELRITKVTFDAEAKKILLENPDPTVKIIAHRPDQRTVEEYDAKLRRTCEAHHLNPDAYYIFLEVDISDASLFRAPIVVRGHRVGRHKILRTESPAVPNAIAAILLEIEKLTGKVPHAYFGWTEGNPFTYMLRYFFLGEGDVAPMTREILRRAVANPEDRPYIHVV